MERRDICYRRVTIVFEDFADQWLYLAKACGEFGGTYDRFVH
jgi:hypothetical protein